jgi:hypothetical protein
MNQPLALGRRLPRNDWEGDDLTPGAGGRFVTCVDTAVGRAVAWATNGRTDKDGKVYRHALVPYDPNFSNLAQHVQSVRAVARLPLIIPQRWAWADVTAWLTAGKGLVVVGRYDSLPRAYRYQKSGDFYHAVWCSHRSATSGIRVWDPLNPDTTAYGRWLPPAVVRAFVESASGAYAEAAYVPLQPLVLTP